jgi:hypothetical protein
MGTGSGYRYRILENVTARPVPVPIFSQPFTTCGRRYQSVFFRGRMCDVFGNRLPNRQTATRGHRYPTLFGGIGTVTNRVFGNRLSLGSILLAVK